MSYFLACEGSLSQNVPYDDNCNTDLGSGESLWHFLSTSTPFIVAELVNLIDDKSLALIMRDAPDEGRKALEILRAHYAGCSKPRVITLYTELTRLSKDDGETRKDA